MMTNMIYDFDLKFSSMCKFSITSATRRRTWDWWWICIFYLIVVFIIWSPGSGEVTLGSGGINNICIETGCSSAVKWSRRRQECRTLLQQRNQGGSIMGASIPHWTLRAQMLYGVWYRVSQKKVGSQKQWLELLWNPSEREKVGVFRKIQH